ncbi:hypothetical protein FPL06_13650 [Xanthomonas citri pv. glycines]|nr:hypothetical protein FPL06_13650 [Xanthomonas citri pv. glycines]
MGHGADIDSALGKLEWFYGWRGALSGMGNGEWGMGDGEWGMGNGEWGMGNGESQIAKALGLPAASPRRRAVL